LRMVDSRKRRKPAKTYPARHRKTMGTRRLRNKKRIKSARPRAVNWAGFRRCTKNLPTIFLISNRALIARDASMTAGLRCAASICDSYNVVPPSVSKIYAASGN
jgi:hypothetical protein